VGDHGDQQPFKDGAIDPNPRPGTRTLSGLGRRSHGPLPEEIVRQIEEYIEQRLPEEEPSTETPKEHW
jgi:hypothetical protein